MVKRASDEAKRRGEEVAGTSMATWSPTVNLLAVVADRLAVLIELGKAKPGKPVQYPRPKTAFDRLEVAEMRDIHERLTAALIAPTE